MPMREVDEDTDRGQRSGRTVRLSNGLRALIAVAIVGWGAVTVADHADKWWHQAIAPLPTVNVANLEDRIATSLQTDLDDPAKGDSADLHIAVSHEMNLIETGEHTYHGLLTTHTAKGTDELVEVTAYANPDHASGNSTPVT
jgi:hypothetical protein